MIEDFLLGIFVGFTLPFIIRYRGNIMAFLKVGKRRNGNAKN